MIKITKHACVNHGGFFYGITNDVFGICQQLQNMIDVFFQCACYQIQLDLVGVFLNKDCPDGWQHNNHSCYKIFTNDVGITWPEANRKCNQQNGSLVSIASKQELEYVHYLVTNSLDLIWDKQMFIGLSLNNCERGLISLS